MKFCVCVIKNRKLQLVFSFSGLNENYRERNGKFCNYFIDFAAKKAIQTRRKKVLNRICHLFDDKKMAVVKARGRVVYFPARQINKRKKKCKFKFAFKHFSQFSNPRRSARRVKSFSCLNNKAISGRLCNIINVRGPFTFTAA